MKTATGSQRSEAQETGEAGAGQTIRQSPAGYVCMKYNRREAGEALACQDPDLYCKFRPQCMIHYMDKRRRRQVRDGGGDDS